jgi:hypothetical protein
VATDEPSLDMLLDELIDTHGSPGHADGTILGQEPTQDEPVPEEIEDDAAPIGEQVCVVENQISLRDNMRAMQDSQSNTQAATILAKTSILPQDERQTHHETLNVVYDEHTVPLWCSDYEDAEIKFLKTDNQAVFTQCYAAGFKLTTDPPAPHTEDLTIATVDTGLETDHLERPTNLIGSIRTQVKTQVNKAFLAGVKYRDDIAYYCAVEDEGPPIPTVPFADLLGKEAHVDAKQKVLAVRDFRNLKRGEHDTKKRS